MPCLRSRRETDSPAVEDVCEWMAPRDRSGSGLYPIKDTSRRAGFQVYVLVALGVRRDVANSEPHRWSCWARSSPNRPVSCQVSCPADCPRNRLPGCCPGCGPIRCPLCSPRCSTRCSPGRSDRCGLSSRPRCSLHCSVRCSPGCLQSYFPNCPPSCSVRCFPGYGCRYTPIETFEHAE